MCGDCIVGMPPGRLNCQATNPAKSRVKGFACRTKRLPSWCRGPCPRRTRRPRPWKPAAPLRGPPYGSRDRRRRRSIGDARTRANGRPAPRRRGFRDAPIGASRMNGSTGVGPLNNRWTFSSFCVESAGFAFERLALPVGGANPFWYAPHSKAQRSSEHNKSRPTPGPPRPRRTSGGILAALLGCLVAWDDSVPRLRCVLTRDPMIY